MNNAHVEPNLHQSGAKMKSIVGWRHEKNCRSKIEQLAIRGRV